MTDRYQGYTNYETWNVTLWLSNDEPLYDDARRIVRRAASPYRAQDALRDFVRELMPEVPGMAGDLLGHALERVDWAEVAEAFTEE